MMRLKNSIEYRLFPIPFMVLTLCGSWYSDSWPEKTKFIYKIFMFCILFLGIVLFIEILIQIILTSGTDKLNLENVFAGIVFAVGIYKKINLMYYRQKILDFICKYTENKWYKPKNIAEDMIYTDIQHETRWVTTIYASFIIISIFLRSATPIIEAKSFIILLLDGWYPYKTDNFFSFWLTYFHQIIGGVTLTCMHISTDTLFVGLLLQMKFQLKILKHRLREFGTFKTKNNNSSTEIKNEKIIKIISQRVREHESIHRFGNDLQDTFKPILAGQIVVVIPSVIINVYFLSVYTDRLNSKYFTTFLFALVSLMQIYMFCWYGNEIVLNSADVGDAMYESHWIDLDQSTKKNIITIMMRTSHSIMISAVAIIPLNIDSFLKIMKTSYSAFNLLQRTTTQY